MKKKTSTPAEAIASVGSLVVRTPSDIKAAVAPPPTKKEIIEALAVKLVEQTKILYSKYVTEAEALKDELAAAINVDALDCFTKAKVRMPTLPGVRDHNEGRCGVYDRYGNSIRPELFSRDLDRAKAGEAYITSGTAANGDGTIRLVAVELVESKATKAIRAKLEDTRVKLRDARWSVQPAEVQGCTTSSPLSHAKKLIEAKMSATVTSERVATLLENDETNAALNKLLDKLTATDEAARGPATIEV